MEVVKKARHGARGKRRQPVRDAGWQGRSRQVTCKMQSRREAESADGYPEKAGARGGAEMWGYWEERGRVSDGKSLDERVDERPGECTPSGSRAEKQRRRHARGEGVGLGPRGGGGARSQTSLPLPYAMATIRTPRAAMQSRGACHFCSLYIYIVLCIYCTGILQATT